MGEMMRDQMVGKLPDETVFEKIAITRLGAALGKGLPSRTACMCAVLRMWTPTGWPA